MQKIITIVKPHEEAFILNGVEYTVIAALATPEDISLAMGAVAKELLSESMFFEYQKMFFETRLLKSILKK